MTRAAAASLALLLAAGCSTGGDYPSLAPRPVERLGFEEPVGVDPPVAPDPALSTAAAELVAQARAGDGQFETVYARALPAARGAGPPDTESWVEAQEWISRTEAARAPTARALAALDLLLVERADEPINDAVYAGLIEARDAVAALANQQVRRITILRRIVSGG